MFSKIHYISLILSVGFSYYWFNYIKRGPVYHSDKSLKGKTVLITGGNAGIGKALAIELAKRDARIIIASRNLAKSNQARLEIIKHSGNQNIFSRKLDLSDFKGVRKFAKSFNETETYLDYLINNAGAIDAAGRTTTGINRMFAINHFGHFLLTNLLLDKMKSQSKQRPVRIVNLSSGIYRIGTLSHEAFYEDNSEGIFEIFRVYSNSKLANIYFSAELHNRLKDYDITTYSVHPGAIDTELGKNHPSKFGDLLRVWVITPLFLRDPLYGYQTILYCALDDDVIQYSGDYFEDCARVELMSHAKNASMGKWLWDESMKITGLV